MLLSIDVGIRNLAMCMINETTQAITHWDVSGVPPDHKDGLYPCFRDHLNARQWVLDAQTILIEKQPGQNKKMKTVENFLQAYFVIKSPESETIIYDARHKVPDVAGPGKARYRQRKQTAIVRCKEFVEKGPSNKNWIEHFKKSKKKDDLADTVLQALSYINRVETTKKKEIKKKKLNARKPTQNQIETKYSKSNLAWFIKNKSREELNKDKRFNKDLKRYFRDIDELIKDLSLK
jgi:hypothetical protein